MRIRVPTSAVLRATAAAVLLVASAAAAAAQGDRAAKLLSDQPAPRRDCRIANRPSPLPGADQVVDSAALAEAVAAVHARGAQEGGFALFSISFASSGAVERVAVIEQRLPEGQADSLQAAVRRRARARAPGQAFSLRLRVEPGAAQPFRVGYSETCPPSTTLYLGLNSNFGTRTFSLRPVRATLAIAADGAVKQVDLINSSGNGEVDRWVEHAVGGWKFTPALVDGIPTAVTHEETIRIRTH